MNKRLENLEKHIHKLEKRLGESPTHQDIEAVAAALRLELFDHVEDK